MSEFLDILTHGRRLQGAVKELSITELEAVQEKLASIIAKRVEKEKVEEQAKQEKFKKIAEIQKQLEEAGLDINDLKSAPVEKNGTGKKRPIKFELTDENGNVHRWTGIGRMPRVYKQALENGKSLEDFAI
ncbi:H-NS family nucleoid-associated regulatory protein [Aestuariibacter sp. A3R04]|uniref:H-NS histone family protein n=1 Tax=Aestuariibacter sp. A3R04 TaxID=2841571 RepID=UPI001C0A62FD|nr:H-NS family nucleoid-associated regulatory protein [Aestuariibacter sp. A3R04]MBU3022753.1 H-NS histone family protein [Aestuariibacter sp. A3R04]